MQLVYNKEADALTIWFSNIEPHRTIDLADDIFVDLDSDGKVAGIEVLHASEKANLIDFSKNSTSPNSAEIIESIMPGLPSAD